MRIDIDHGRIALYVRLSRQVIGPLLLTFAVAALAGCSSDDGGLDEAAGSTAQDPTGVTAITDGDDGSTDEVAPAPGSDGQAAEDASHLTLGSLSEISLYDRAALVEAADLIVVGTPVSFDTGKVVTIDRLATGPNQLNEALYLQPVEIERVIFGDTSAESIDLAVSGPDLGDERTRELLQKATVTLGEGGFGLLPSTRHVLFLRSTRATLGASDVDAYTIVGVYQGAIELGPADELVQRAYAATNIDSTLRVGASVSSVDRALVDGYVGQTLEAVVADSLERDPFSVPEPLDAFDESVVTVVSLGPDRYQVEIKAGAAHQIVFVLVCGGSYATAADCDDRSLETLVLSADGSGSLTYTVPKLGLVGLNSHDCSGEPGCVLVVSEGIRALAAFDLPRVG